MLYILVFHVGKQMLRRIKCLYKLCHTLDEFSQRLGKIYMINLSLAVHGIIAPKFPFSSEKRGNTNGQRGRRLVRDDRSDDTLKSRRNSW